MENKEITKISNGNQGDVNIPKVCLGDTLMNPPKVNPFFTTLFISNKFVRNWMIDLGASINIIPVGVMKRLGMWVDTTGGKFYAMDSRHVPVVGIMKDVEVKLAAHPQAAYTIDITIIDTTPHFGMLLSRQWTTLVGGNVQFDLSYAIIPINGEEVKLYIEPRVNQIVEYVDQN